MLLPLPFARRTLLATSQEGRRPIAALGNERRDKTEHAIGRTIVERLVVGQRINSFQSFEVSSREVWGYPLGRGSGAACVYFPLLASARQADSSSSSGRRSVARSIRCVAV
uniref:Uncharacterized protein n=1 Tax=Vespula pensylvanica TaxID=30213 RepID=A0A834NXC1_VESPE|nr:hypothetical protein H0235_010625 [Vespula pensylvanica]